VFRKGPDPDISDEFALRANRDMEGQRVERVIVAIPTCLSRKPRPAAVRVEDAAAEFRDLRQDSRILPCGGGGRNKLPLVS
jgi:hypothetical protein